jgi:hypothetical protein
VQLPSRTHSTVEKVYPKDRFANAETIYVESGIYDEAEIPCKCSLSSTQQVMEKSFLGFTHGGMGSNSAGCSLRHSPLTGRWLRQELIYQGNKSVGFMKHQVAAIVAKVLPSMDRLSDTCRLQYLRSVVLRRRERPSWLQSSKPKLACDSLIVDQKF